MTRGSVSLVPDVTIFFGGAALVAGVVAWGVPAATAAGLDPLAAWMLLSVPLVFAPIVAAGLWVLRREHGRERWSVRLRLLRPSARDWLWGLLGWIGIALASGALLRVCQVAGLNPNPPFARDVQPLTGDRLWMLGLWAVYWPINILAEELVWRGILLPRMQLSLGGSAWLLNSLLWGTFHLAFGLGNLLVLVPSLVLVPLLAQRRHNTWIAVLMHAGLSGPGFIALALGWTG